jgi:uncharacterized protein YbjT (DUF2867 family)
MILVTGASGTVGSQVVRGLLQQGTAFCAGVHSRPLEIEGVESRTLDFDRPETLGPALEGVRTVYLVSYETLHEKAMVTAARDAGVERIVKQSAWRAGDEAFIVGRWHREVEREIEGSGMAWTFLRPNMFMQNLVTVHGESIREENAFYESAGDARVSYIDVRDVARVAARVLTERGHDGRAYDLSGREAVTHAAIAEMLTQALGRTIRFVRISDEEFRQRWTSQGASEEEAEAWVDISRYFRTGACSDVTTTVHDLTGREPGSFPEFCRDYAAELAPGYCGAQAGLE